MLAYTGSRPSPTLPRRCASPSRSVPNAYKLVAGAVFAIYFTLPLIAALGAPGQGDRRAAHDAPALPPDQGGYANDPILGLVDNLGLIGGLTLDGLQIYVGVLAATILVIATNAGVIGASRITYSMASYRQLPEIFRRLHPQFKTPWLSLDRLRRHCADPDHLAGRHEVRRDALTRSVPRCLSPSLTALVRCGSPIEGASGASPTEPGRTCGSAPSTWPLFASLGGARNRHLLSGHRRPEPDDPLGRDRLARPRARRLRRLPAARRRSSAARDRARRRPPLARRSLSSTAGCSFRSSRACPPTMPSTSHAALLSSEEPRIIALNVSRCHAIRASPRSCPTSRARADRELDRSGRDRRRLRRARDLRGSSVAEAPPRRSSQRPSARTEIIVLGSPRKALTRASRVLFGTTVDYVMRHAPCRVMVTASRARRPA